MEQEPLESRGKMEDSACAGNSFKDGRKGERKKRCHLERGVGSRKRFFGVGAVFLFAFFFFFWLCWVFVDRGLSLVAASSGYSSWQHAGFSVWWLLLLQSTGSRHVGFSSCGTWAQ